MNMKNTPSGQNSLFTLLFFFAALVIIYIYFAPVLSGKDLFQSDILQTTGSLKEAKDYGKKGQEILWSNSMFSGMPVWRGFGDNILIYLHKLLNNIFPTPILLCLIGFIGFFLLLRVFEVNTWLSFIGGIAFIFSSFNLISLEAGHINKVFDMMLMAPVLAGVILTYKGKYWAGAGLTTLALALQIFYSHVQISYYLLIMILFLGGTELILSIKNKTLPSFLKASAILIVCALIAVAPNFSRLWTMAEYAQSTTRGESELSAKQHEGGGLDKEYALSWSNGKLETLTLLIPSLYGGSSNEELNTHSDVYQTMIRNGVTQNQAKEYIKNMPLYWGTQPFTAGPVYFGAIICFLFILGLFLIKEPFKWPILLVTILSIMLSWGKNFEPLTDLFFFHVPLYNKFRSVTMILSIAQLTFPLLAMITVYKITKGEFNKAEVIKGLKWSLGITGGTALFFALFGTGLFSFSSDSDKQQLPQWLLDALISDRETALRSDAFRSLFFIVACAGLLWVFISGKLKEQYLYLVLSLLVLLDLLPVDKRYLNKSDFKNQERYENTVFAMSPADQQILQDTTSYYRVFNLTVNPFSDAITSYHHKSIGGYSAIKLGRYQDLIEAHLSKNNMKVLDMLNTKYFIVTDPNSHEIQVQQNPQALGNAWFVDSIKIAANADEELQSLNNLNPATTAIVDKRYNEYVKKLSDLSNSVGIIRMTEYHPNHISYHSSNPIEQLAVFSEIYYQPGWNAYIDGKKTEHIRVNYVLRALKIPQGDHTIEFKFEPKSYFIGEKISLAGSTIFLIFLLLILGREISVYYTKKK